MADIMDEIIYKVALENNRISHEISEILKGGMNSNEEFFTKMKLINQKSEAIANNLERLAVLVSLNKKQC